MILAIFLVCLLAISAVSAQDNATSDVVGIDDNDDVIVESSDDSYVLKDTVSTFGSLSFRILNESTNEVYLDRDYFYIGPEYYTDENNVTHTLVDEKGIFINHTMTIHGNGHKFDADGRARVFGILASNVVLEDIEFVNCYAYESGGAIYWNANSGSITNCNFTNCYAGSDGGAIFMNSSLGAVSNCNFKNIRSENSAGVIYWNGISGTVSDCSFTNCSSERDGGAAIKWYGAKGTVANSKFDDCRGFSAGWAGSGPIDWCGENGLVFNCSFTDSWSGRAGAILWEAANGTVDKCNFDNCSESAYGAIYWIGENGVVTDCNFSNSQDSKTGSASRGAAICWEGVNGTLINSDFIKCSSASGGAVYWEGVNGTLINSNFIKCSAGDGGAVWWNGVNGTLDNSNFIKCSASSGGAVLWSGDGNDGVISDSNFRDCCANEGGAVYLYTGTNSNCTFINCSANKTGGAVHWFHSLGSVYDCSFFNCSANEDGGAIYNQANIVYGSSFGKGVYVYNSIFTNNSAYNGGAYKATDNKGNVIGCIFINNSASNTGGAIVSIRDVIDCTFINNIAAGGHGGALDSLYDVINCSFYNSSAMKYGGAVKSAGNVINCSFNDCSAKETGGAIYDSKDVLNCNFTNCYATAAGAIYEPKNVDGSSFNNCRALDLAGAIQVKDYGTSGRSVTNCNFTDCSSVNGSAGAVYWGSSEGVLSYSNFMNCSAKKDGGAIYWDGRDGIMRNNDFTNCSANHGGAIASGSVRDCTFFDNRANEGNNWYHTSVPTLNLMVSNFNSTYGFDDGVFLNATNKNAIAVNDVIVTIRVYKNDALVGTYDALTNTDWIVDLDAGNYTAEMAIEHNAYILAKVVKISLTIAKMPTDIAADSVLTVYNADDYLVATLKDIKGNPIANVPISVNIIDIANVTTDENGTVKVPTKDLASGNYVATITFDGNSNYGNSSAVANVTVEKAGPVISASSLTTVYNGGKYLYVTLMDANGNPIVGAKISINLNGAKSATTGNDGKAKLTTDKLVPKTYTANIIFAGDDNYMNASTTAKVKVTKATPKITASKKTYKVSVKTKKYTITLKVNGKVMKSTKVYLKVNKKTFTAKTNSKGQATFKITNLKKKGTFSATITYKATKYYNKATKTVKITTKK